MRLCCQLSAASGIIENQHYPILFVLNQPSFYQIYPLNHLNDLRAYLLGNWDFLITLARGIQQKNGQCIPENEHYIGTPKMKFWKTINSFSNRKKLFRFHLNFLKGTPQQKTSGIIQSIKIKWNLTNGPLRKVPISSQILRFSGVLFGCILLEISWRSNSNHFFCHPKTVGKRCCSSKFPSRVLS